jgi:hypothetical protein
LVDEETPLLLLVELEENRAFDLAACVAEVSEVTDALPRAEDGIGALDRDLGVTRRAVVTVLV